MGKERKKEAVPAVILAQELGQAIPILFYDERRVPTGV